MLTYEDARKVLDCDAATGALTWDRADNRIVNLRIADRSGNRHNQRRPKHNTSGFKGVCWNSKSKKWQAGIRSRGKVYYLGLHETPEAAHDAYKNAAASLHKEFARFG